MMTNLMILIFLNKSHFALNHLGYRFELCAIHSLNKAQLLRIASTYQSNT